MSKSIYVILLPILSLAALAGAMVVGMTSLNPWGSFEDSAQDGFQVYGWAAPEWFAFTLLGLTLAAWISAVIFKRIWITYAAILLALPFGTGDKLLLDGAVLQRDILWTAVFTGLLVCSLECLSARARFENVLASTANLDKTERRGSQAFLSLYFVQLVGAVVLFTAFTTILVTWVVPSIAGVMSERLQNGLEMRSSVGIALFGAILLSIPMLIRASITGFQNTAEVTDA
ncbi:MAG: hypothetical protein ACPHK8_02980 [Thermoplasmatota archaeon]